MNNLSALPFLQAGNFKPVTFFRIYNPHRHPIALIFGEDKEGFYALVKIETQLLSGDRHDWRDLFCKREGPARIKESMAVNLVPTFFFSKIEGAIFHKFFDLVRRKISIN